MKEPYRKYLKSLIIRVLICIILFLSISIYVNYSNKNLLLFKNHVYDKSLKFNKVTELYNKIFGSVIPLDDKKIQVVTKEMNYTSFNSYKDGAALIGVSAVYPFKSGIVVFIGNKDEYGNTIIIQGMDGIDYWYSNVGDVSVKIYDYVDASTIIANAVDNKVYVVFMKNGEVLNYEEYI